MENLMVMPSISIPSIPAHIRNKQNSSSLSHSSPTKPAKSSVYIRNNSRLNSAESRLAYLCKRRRLDEAVAALDSIPRDGSSKVSPAIFIKLIQLCTDSYSIEMGRKVHGRIDLVADKNDQGVETMLVGMYSKCGFLKESRQVFEGMRERDLYAWSAMIGGCLREQRWKEVVELFYGMMREGVLPDDFLLPKILQACGNCGDVQTGRLLHCLAVKSGFESGSFVGNSIMSLYAKFGELGLARKCFESMEERDTVAWTAMISGCFLNRNFEEGFRLFDAMHEEGLEPSPITYNVLIKACCETGHQQYGNEDRAVDLFLRMQKDGKIKPDTASWNCLISGYLQIGQKERAFGVFRLMQSLGVSPDPVTILSLLSACANLISLRKVKEIHGYLLRRKLDSRLPITNALIDSYAKSGQIEYSRTIFSGASSKDVITWNSLISGYVIHGFPDLALDTFNHMRNMGFKPSNNTLVNIIHAHSRTGMLAEGEQVFSRMMEEYQVMPGLEHYSAMIDLYGRCGQLNKAQDFIKRMPIKPDGSVWSTFLSACRIHGDLELVINARERLLELEPWNARTHQSILQAYGLRETPDDAKDEEYKKDNKALKPTGQSWIEMKNIVHSFVSGDRSKSCSDLLFAWVESISREVKQHNLHGGFCIHENEEEEKEETVGVHSEKLALAFAFVSSPSIPQSVRIMKNLRMCGDCHVMAKFVSKKYGCHIYLNDSECFHHFKHGQCSCGDY
ncbi:hypothetical protein Tsubulata_030948 [Turnera subulata]|uniref:DYW domain-containing protein n=1 Tax=Turnera subulata TaxID=218843 RepID=A0A9Q0FUU2_9ROSI|nr:hypothetical protein Tsubulata_030948 [Turnera subulata]